LEAPIEIKLSATLMKGECFGKKMGISGPV